MHYLKIKPFLLLWSIIVGIGFSFQNVYATNDFLKYFEKNEALIQKKYDEYILKVQIMAQTHLSIAEFFPLGDTFAFKPGAPIVHEDMLAALSKQTEDEYFIAAVLPAVNSFSWAIPNDLAIETIKKYGPILEIGAGGGYWAYLLQKAGGDVVAYDDQSWVKESKIYQGAIKWFDVREGNEEAILSHLDRNLFLCYPPRTNDYPLASNSLDRFKGEYLIYVGGRIGGVTGDDRFYGLLELDFDLVEAVSLPHWPGHDNVDLKVYRRKNLKLKSPVEKSMIDPEFKEKLPVFLDF